MNPIQALADAVVASHPEMSVDVSVSTPVSLLHDSADIPTEQAAVMQACRRLGFIERDATWQRQTERTGHFDPHAWPHLPDDFGLRPWPRTNAFPTCPQHLGLYAVLPDAAWVGRMARAGVPTVQLRFKSEDPTAIRREVEASVRAVEGTGALLFINDHWQAAIEAGAYGLHLGQEDLADAPIDRIRSSGLRLGVSTHGYAEMMLADQVSPSYLALGAVFPTTLKRMATAPQGTGRLQAYAKLMNHYPLVAIGGIDLDKLPAVLASGVGSVAVVRAITSAEHPEAAAQFFIRAIEAKNHPEITLYSMD